MQVRHYPVRTKSNYKRTFFNEYAALQIVFTTVSIKDFPYLAMLSLLQSKTPRECWAEQPGRPRLLYSMILIIYVYTHMYTLVSTPYKQNLVGFSERDQTKAMLVWQQVYSYMTADWPYSQLGNYESSTPSSYWIRGCHVSEDNQSILHGGWTSRIYHEQVCTFLDREDRVRFLKRRGTRNFIYTISSSFPLIWDRCIARCFQVCNGLRRDRHNMNGPVLQGRVSWDIDELGRECKDVYILY